MAAVVEGNSKCPGYRMYVIKADPRGSRAASTTSRPEPSSPRRRAR